MKTQILISKSSWANDYKKKIVNKLKHHFNQIYFCNSHNKLKKNYDLNIIFSYFKIIPNTYLKRSRFNIIPHESDLPRGRGMSPLTWQILEGKKKIFFSLIEASTKLDNGLIYYKKTQKIPKDILFDEIKKIQFNENLKLIIKFIKYFKKNKKAPNGKIQTGKGYFYKQRFPNDSEINIKHSIQSQFNLLRVVDNKNYPAYFRIYDKKYILKISNE